MLQDNIFQKIIDRRRGRHGLPEGDGTSLVAHPAGTHRITMANQTRGILKRIITQEGSLVMSKPGTPRENAAAAPGRDS